MTSMNISRKKVGNNPGGHGLKRRSGIHIELATRHIMIQDKIIKIEKTKQYSRKCNNIATFISINNTWLELMDQ